MVANQTNVHMPMWKKSFKAQHGRIPIDPAILAANWTSFHSPPKKKIKNADARVWGNVCGEQKPETFFVGLRYNIGNVGKNHFYMYVCFLESSSN